MKKSLLVASAAALAGAAFLTCTPAMAHERVGVSLSLGLPLPIAPVAVYAPPAPVYYAPPAAQVVVVGGYRPVVPVVAPYYAHYDRRFHRVAYRGWR
jgi:hypothetical protein